MNLAIDIGNTRTKIGIYDKENEIKVFVFDNNAELSLNPIIQQYNIQKAILSSTIDVPNTLLDVLKTLPLFLIFYEQTHLPFINKYDTQNTLGKDRLALIAAAHAQFPNQNNLVIGCGTCITFNFINQHHEFLGGSIHPGLKMRLKAMHCFTGKLPLVELEKEASLFGNNTKSNILSGVLYAACKEIDGMIDDYLVKFSEMNIILTGGDTNLLVYRLKNQIFVTPNFTLLGLNHILEYNA